MNQLIKTAFDGVQKIKVTTLCVVLAVFAAGCGTSTDMNSGDETTQTIKLEDGEENPVGTNNDDENLQCDCEDELFYYYQLGDEKVFLGDLLLYDRLLVGFNEQTEETEILSFINEVGLFKPVLSNDIFHYEYFGESDFLMFVTFEKQKTCTQLKEVIRELEKAPIVSYTSLSFKGNTFTDKHDVPQAGFVRVGAFLPYFEVKVHERGLYPSTDLINYQEREDFLYALAEEMNTKVMCQVYGIFIIRADKNSKGDAMQMGNLFYETRKFPISCVDLIANDLKINP